jgi:hypothetical protein
MDGTVPWDIAIGPAITSPMDSFANVIGIPRNMALFSIEQGIVPPDLGFGLAHILTDHSNMRQVNTCPTGCTDRYVDNP